MSLIKTLLAFTFRPSNESNQACIASCPASAGGNLRPGLIDTRQCFRSPQLALAEIFLIPAAQPQLSCWLDLPGLIVIVLQSTRRCPVDLFGSPPHSPRAQCCTVLNGVRSPRT